MSEPVKIIHATEWQAILSEDDAAENTSALEHGQLLHLPRLAFSLSADERRFQSQERQLQPGDATNQAYLG